MSVAKNVPLAQSQTSLGTQSRPLDFVAALAALAMLLGPFYVGPSGLPQPTDLVTVFVVLAFAFTEGSSYTFRRSHTLFVSCLVGFGMWVFVVNLTWTWIISDWNLAGKSMYYTYNMAVALTFIGLHRRYGSIVNRGLVAILAFTLIAQVLLIPVGRVWGGGRLQVFFNNPNQLAYYAVLSASIFFAVNCRQRYSTWQQVVVYGCCAVLVAASLSRAAAGALGLLLVLVAIRRPNGAVLGLALGIFVVVLMGFDVDIVENATGRIGRVGHDSQRGYDRIFNHPQYLLLGAGEGAATRFKSVLKVHELHSSFGAVLFSYGLIGITLLTGAYVAAVRAAGFWPALSLVAPFIFGLTHQGLRFPLFWIHLAVLVTLWDHGEDPEELAAHETTRRPAPSRLG